MSDKTIQIQINGKEYEVPEGSTILEACRKAGWHVPTLCHHDDLTIAGICRICVVEVEGWRTLQAACATPVAPNMKIHTYSDKVRLARRNILELMLADHYGECYSCLRNQKCELQKLAYEYGIDEYYFGHKTERKWKVDESSYSVVRDKDKCIQCNRCIRTCEGIQTVGIFEKVFKGHECTVDTFWNHPMRETICINCGQCINRCPTAALKEKNETDQVWEAIADPTKTVVIQTAPAPRSAIGEEFGLPAGVCVTKKLNTALRAIGFDKVLDTNFTADLTIMEEGTELLMRLKKHFTKEDCIHNATLPMITSCSPGWVKFCEHFFPEQLDHLSSCKSPQQMFGALIKTYVAEKMNVDPKNIVSVALMPCTAKKFECNRPEMNDSGFKDVDFGLTTREMGQMIRETGIKILDLPESDFDNPIGHGSGAGMIFGATGGVMEAALRTAYELVTGREVPFKQLDIMPVRGMDGVREAPVKFENVKPEWSFLEGVEAWFAVAHGTGNARVLLDQIAAGTSKYVFIEIMACPGGCLGGGGMPIPTNLEIRKARAQAIYAEDHAMEIRKSHDNKLVMELYKDFLGAPLGHKSHKLLHTHYTPRGKKAVDPKGSV